MPFLRNAARVYMYIGCNFLPEFPNGLGQACPNLSELNLSGNQIRHISDAELAACPKLQVLKVYLMHNTQRCFFPSTRPTILILTTIICDLFVYTDTTQSLRKSPRRIDKFDSVTNLIHTCQ